MTYYGFITDNWEHSTDLRRDDFWYICWNHSTFTDWIIIIVRFLISHQEDEDLGGTILNSQLLTAILKQSRITLGVHSK